ncbi:hypothetical protein I3760_07G229300 [Carya illinoinensis]|nr:hypothetical protein I3760_07G229300 [Carya illinoinensis]
MDLEGSERVSQVSFGGFDSNVRTKDLVECLEYKVGTVFRCRLNTSQLFLILLNTQTHPPRAKPKWALPWRGFPTLKIKYKNKNDTIFSFKSTSKYAVIKCNFKMEFVVIDINEIKCYNDTSYLVILLHLASSPCMWYRTVDDDIEEPVPFDLLDDDDPWIRTTYFTPSGDIGRCSSYRVSIPPRHGVKWRRTMEYLKEQRVHEIYLDKPLRIRDEPEFGLPLSDPFFCIQYKQGIAFEIVFLVNAVWRIFSQHQLSDNFFNLLSSQPKEVNIAALKYICSYRRLDWLLRNPKLFKSPRQLDDIVEVRRLVITPTKAYCLPPEVELSNRVLRKYKGVADRFLRVTFMDEGMQTMNSNVLNSYVSSIVKLITSNSYPQKTKNIPKGE